MSPIELFWTAKNESIRKKIKKKKVKKKYITAWGGNRGKETKKTKQM